MVRLFAPPSHSWFLAPIQTDRTRLFSIRDLCSQFLAHPPSTVSILREPFPGSWTKCPRPWPPSSSLFAAALSSYRFFSEASTPTSILAWMSRPQAPRSDRSTSKGRAGVPGPSGERFHPPPGVVPPEVSVGCFLQAQPARCAGTLLQPQPQTCRSACVTRCFPGSMAGAVRTASRPFTPCSEWVLCG